MQNLLKVLQHHNFVIAERHEPGLSRVNSLYKLRDVQQKEVMN